SNNRVEEVLDLVGLTEVAGKRVGGFSLGMYQRLGIATALLGDPATLLFDEPVNGLDPEGIQWVRNLMKDFAAEGRTVLVSSHLMGEMQQTADRVVIIGRGRLVADVDVAELTEKATGNQVRVLSPEPARLSELLSAEGASVEGDAEGGLLVGSMDAPHVGEIAAANGVRLQELTPRRVSLEAAFMELTHDSVTYRSNGSAEAAHAATTPNEDKGI
ncbi:MAG: ATP-binding cassette domain-containing protein, partial [Rubrobacteraceae bacterium]